MLDDDELIPFVPKGLSGSDSSIRAVCERVGFLRVSQKCADYRCAPPI
jgi:hypothetical protein